MTSPAGYADAHHCETPHPRPRWAVVLLHLSESTSAANVASLCDDCWRAFAETWLALTLAGEPDQAYEIRPVAQPSDEQLLAVTG